MNGKTLKHKIKTQAGIDNLHSMAGENVGPHNALLDSSQPIPENSWAGGRHGTAPTNGSPRMVPNDSEVNKNTGVSLKSVVPDVPGIWRAIFRTPGPVKIE